MTAFKTLSTFSALVFTAVSIDVWTQRRLTMKRHVTNITFVRFLSGVDSGMHSKHWWPCESFVTNTTLKRFLSFMTPFVFHQIMIASVTLSAFGALVFTAVNNLMLTQGPLTTKTFLTLRTWIPVAFDVFSSVKIQTWLQYKPFITHCTDIWPGFVNKWMLSDIGFSLPLKWTPCT